ncbi:MAG TPA: FkbM family methyltransferase [Bacteroidia bacterium]|nr:FkbM family methyltransferase [Bacteroidia bacterium]
MNIKVPARLVQTYKESFLDEVYYKGLPGNLMGNTPVIIDIGANVGYFSLFSLMRFPKAKLLAFEPMPMNFRLLEKYCREHKEYDFTPVNKAVSGEKGHITLQYDASDSFTTSATIFDTSHGSDTLQVETTTLANIIATYNLDRINLLKLDCEGSEYSILYGADDDVWAKIKALSIETHKGSGEKQNTEDLVVYLRQKGYTTKSEGDIVWAFRQ